MDVLSNYQWHIGAIRTRAAAVDRFAGLRGHAYIAARQLDAPVRRVDRNTPQKLEAIRNILAARYERRHGSSAEFTMWNHLSDDSILTVFEHPAAVEA